MVNLSNRSYQKELLDEDNIPFNEIEVNMQELNKINSLLGGHAITIKGFQKLLNNSQTDKTLKICEIGCGGGDNLKAIADYCGKSNIKIQLTGIDLKRECLNFAQVRYAGLAATWICSDYINVNFDKEPPDIIFSSLFCHHFTDEQLVKQLQWMKANSRQGFFINDLQRSMLAYYSIKWITAIFSASYLVKNDAPLSVARAFSKKDWIRLFRLSGIKPSSLEWKWAFRYLITFRHG